MCIQDLVLEGIKTQYRWLQGKEWGQDGNGYVCMCHNANIDYRFCYPEFSVRWIIIITSSKWASSQCSRDQRMTHNQIQAHFQKNSQTLSSSSSISMTVVDLMVWGVVIYFLARVIILSIKRQSVSWLISPKTDTTNPKWFHWNLSTGWMFSH